jgi:4-amino-4-deoxy-L-arabinose transferase-like glycosyltransferase
MTQRAPAALAVLFFVAMPTFARWASSGYVDLPMAFFYALNAYFTWKYTIQPSPTSVALAGLSIGLAAWTKNAAVFGIGLWLLWLAVLWWQKRISLRLIALSILICFGVCGAWYLRNWLEIGLLVPPTAWVDKAEHNWQTVFVFVTLPQNFALTGWLITLACGAALIAFIRRKLPLHRRFLLLYTVPFFIIWWWTTSYDPRFILLFLPLLSVLAGDWFYHLSPKPQKRLPLYLLVVVVISLLLSLYDTWIAVEYKREILRQPIITDATKHNIVLPP